MSRPARIVAVTALLVALGAAAGAVACWLALLGWQLADPATGVAVDPLVLRVALSVGAGLGAVVGPPVAWTWLRRVPLGVAVGIPTLAASGGALAGLAVRAVPLGWLWGALAAVVLSAWWLGRQAAGRHGATVAVLPNEALKLSGYAGMPRRAPRLRHASASSHPHGPAA